jgi:hypothetical protein
MSARVAIGVALAIAVACGGESSRRSARARYNEAIALLDKKEWKAAQTKFLEARDDAGPDPTLRYRAAFNLGIAYAGQADQVAGEDPERALELLSSALAWFRDAGRLRPTDLDAKINAEVVRKRRKQLMDQLNQGKNSLQARLSTLIEDQRALREQVRVLVTAVDEAGASAEPVAFQAEFESLEETERTILAEAGTLLDLAGDERSDVESKPEDQRSDEERMRLAQLSNVEHYVERARGAIADARRSLRRLQGDRAHDRVDGGLAELKRALEQLLDPAAVLKGIAVDQELLASHTAALDELRSGRLSLDGAPPGKPAKPPAWLTTELLSARQRDLGERTGELAARLEAGTSGDASANQAGETDPRAKRMVELARAALPFVKTASEAMRGAQTAIEASQLPDAREKQLEALRALSAAIERFASIRGLIELAYAEQTGLVGLLSPPEPGKDEEKASAPTLTTKDRAKLVEEGVARNLDRLARLEGLLADEVAALEQQAAQAQGQGQGQAASPEEVEGQKQLYQTAEQVRQRAVTALRALAAKPTRADAEAGKKEIEELRRLFFSIVEHLQELLRNQAETHDKTATAHASDDAQRETQIGPLADAQSQHTQRAGELAGALEQQADAASGAQPGQQPGQPSPEEMAKKLAEAAVEVRSALEQMSAASANLTEARDKAGQMSIDLSPALAQQPKALEHLANAIQILQPPQQKPQEDQEQNEQKEQQQDQQQDQQDQQQQQDENLSQQEAQRRLQRVRDREAERQKRQAAPTRQEPVEKDW